MNIIRALVAAATAYLRVLPIIHLRKLYNEHDQISDEIFSLGVTGTPASLMRLELLAKRRERLDQQISAIRSASGDIK